MDGSYHMDPSGPQNWVSSWPPGPWMRCEQCGRCSGEQAVAGSDGGVRGGAAVQLSSGLRIWSHWSLITTTHTASVSSVTALGRDYTIYC